VNEKAALQGGFFIHGAIRFANRDLP